VYESEDKKTFTDYDLAAEDIEVELTCDYNCLVKYEDGKNKVDFTCSHKKIDKLAWAWYYTFMNKFYATVVVPYSGPKRPR
jgi:hypothetical protein